MAKGNQKPLDSKQFKKDERGVIELAQLGIGILVLIVIIAVIALVGDKIDNVAALGATSQWNSSVNTNIVTGVDLWEDTGGLITITAVVAIISVLLGYIFIFGRQPGNGGGQ